MGPLATSGMNAPGEWFWLLAAGVFGLAIGSFINVVITRLPRMMDAGWRLAAADLTGTPAPDDAATRVTLAWPPSACPRCDARLKPWHNVPLISFVALRGRCHECRQRISLRYPLVELMAAAVGLLAVWHLGSTPAALGAVILGWLLLPAAMIDAQTHLLPDSLTLATLWAGLLVSLGHAYGLSPVTPAAAIGGAALGYAALWVLERGFYLITGRRGMGHGDFKLTAALCAWLGASGLPLILFLAACLGLAASGALALSGRMDSARRIAFGPWLALAGWIGFMYGPELVGAYTAAAGLK